MCGICGVIDWTDSGNAAAVVRRMTPAMLHRGPDDEGYLEGGGPSTGRLAIGMRRLSIIDLEGGHQPIFNADGRVGAVLNGEIYNFRELRKQLEDRGHIFHTRSDSEVVAHAYEEWGAACVERFHGMFALAVYDRRYRQGREGNGKLFLARDRLGIKPLYYTAVSNQQIGISESFIFASEVRTLLASGLIPRRLSRAARGREAASRPDMPRSGRRSPARAARRSGSRGSGSAGCRCARRAGGGGRRSR